ncbi:MAG: hypothetical protein H7175_20285 [Burkholderiales bacterium]|nr:hypothetical protein [Anaerolineae bacterium]
MCRPYVISKFVGDATLSRTSNLVPRTLLRFTLYAVLYTSLILTACIPNNNTTPGVATPNGRNPAPLPAPTWVEAGVPISLDNITEIAYLGRLDVAGDSGTVFNHAFAPDATRLIGLNDQQLVAWDLLTGQLAFSTARQQSNLVYYSPDKTELYAIAPDGTVSVYDATRGTLITTFRGHPSYNETAAYYADEGWLALGGLDGEVKVWDTLERVSMVTFRAQELRITALEFSPDGTLLAAGGDDNTVSLWNWRERTQTSVANVDVGLTPINFAFPPSDAAYEPQFAVGTIRNLRLLDASTGASLHILEAGNGGSQILSYSPDGRSLVTGGGDLGMRLWNPANGTLLAELPESTGFRVSAAFSPDSRVLATTVFDGQVNLWDITQITGSTVQRAQLDVGTDQIIDSDWSSDGRLLTLFDATGPIYIWGIGAANP